MRKQVSLRNLILPIFIFIGIFIYVSMMFNNNLWMDEAFSASLVRGKTFADVLRESAEDTLPPLYNIINYINVSIFGFYPWVLRLSSVVPMILTMILGGAFLYKRNSLESALAFETLMWGMPQLLYYGEEIRMYALGFFFVTMAGIFALDLYGCYKAGERNRKNMLLRWPLFLIFSLGSGYTHHFAFVAVGIIYGLLLIGIAITDKRGIIDFLANLFATFVGYMPCLFVTLNQMKRVNGYFSMPDVSLHFVIQCFKLPFTTECTPLSILLLVMFVLAVVFGVFHKECYPAIMCVLVYPGVAIFGIVVTKLFTANIFSERYLFPSIGIMWYGIAIIIGKITEDKLIPDGKKKAILAAFFLIIVCVDIWSYYHFEQEHNDVSVDEMTDFFAQNIKAGDKYIIYEDNYQLEICFRYYFPDFKKTEWEKIMNADDTASLWYIKVPGFEENEKTIAENGFSETVAGDFSFDRYSFELIRLEK